MADLTREELQRLARLGAKARLEELHEEEAAIRRAFPDLFGGRGRGKGTSQASADRATSGQDREGTDTGPGRKGTRRKKRSNMSAAGRKAVSERMKKYWAGRRKESK